MDVRQATIDDIPGIQTVARGSMRESYEFIGDDVLEEALDKLYDDEAMETSVVDSQDVVIVGAVDGEVVAFSQSGIVGSEGGVGEIRWLHVDPDHRDKGIADELLGRTREVLRGLGVSRIRGVVLAGNEEGAAFYEEQGFDRVDSRTVTIAGTEYEEFVFQTGGSGGEPTPAADIERREVDGEEMFVFRDESERGSDGPFHPIYRDRDREELYAWTCGVCGSSDNAMDPMGRLECHGCGNVLRPTRWDAAYL
jgi:ribosomal protein S18 acetylase RimI-like enzyme